MIFGGWVDSAWVTANYFAVNYSVEKLGGCAEATSKNGGIVDFPVAEILCD